jgi:hypothetical protein
MVGRNYRIFGIAAVAAAIGTAIVTILTSNRSRPGASGDPARR